MNTISCSGASVWIRPGRKSVLAIAEICNRVNTVITVVDSCTSIYTQAHDHRAFLQRKSHVLGAPKGPCLHWQFCSPHSTLGPLPTAAQCSKWLQNALHKGWHGRSRACGLAKSGGVCGRAARASVDARSPHCGVPQTKKKRRCNFPSWLPTSLSHSRIKGMLFRMRLVGQLSRFV